jgi:hypothetical protein
MIFEDINRIPAKCHPPSWTMNTKLKTNTKGGLIKTVPKGQRNHSPPLTYTSLRNYKAGRLEKKSLAGRKTSYSDKNVSEKNGKNTQLFCLITFNILLAQDSLSIM